MIIFAYVRFENKKTKIRYIATSLPPVFGVVFTLVGLFVVQSFRIDESWTRADGVVIEVSQSISDGSTTYAPVVSYTVNGRDYRVSSVFHTSSRPTIGQTRQIAYDPANPEKSKVVESTATSLIAYLFPLIGLVCLVLGPFFYIKSRRRGKKIAELR